MRQHPAFFAVATVRRVVRFWTGYWSLRPHYLKYEPFDLPNIPFCLALLYFLVRGVRRWWRLDAKGALPYVLALLLFPLPYYITHSSMDYRQPLEPVIVVLVTIGIFGTGLPGETLDEAAEDHKALSPSLLDFESEPALA